MCVCIYAHTERAHRYSAYCLFTAFDFQPEIPRPLEAAARVCNVQKREVRKRTQSTH